MICPKCGSTHIKKNGSIHNKKKKYQCNRCGRQFVENPQNKIISDETKNLVEKLLLEKIPLAGIARVAGVSEPWLQDCVNQKYAAVPRVVTIIDKPKGHITIECDEMRCAELVEAKLILGDDFLVRGANSLGVVQVQAHAAHVGFMGDVGRIDFHRHRETQRFGDDQGLVGAFGDGGDGRQDNERLHKNRYNRVYSRFHLEYRNKRSSGIS